MRKPLNDDSVLFYFENKNVLQKVKKNEFLVFKNHSILRDILVYKDRRAWVMAQISAEDLLAFAKKVLRDYNKLGKGPLLRHLNPELTFFIPANKDEKIKQRNSQKHSKRVRHGKDLAKKAR